MTGQTVSHYRILEKLGEGGMGVVYRAEDLKLQRTVAIKFLPRGLSGLGEEEKRRFYQEARTASRIDHPNIETVHEIDEVDGETFIVMGFLDGGTLQQKLQREKLRTADVLDLAAQVADGLAAAHEHGIVHRDVKPANVMVTSKGQVKVVDFGLAKLKNAANITRTGGTAGTLSYMSPEQLQKKGEIDHLTDVWSFGVTLYEMLTGELPFKAEEAPAVIRCILEDAPTRPSVLDRRVPALVDPVVERLLRKDREQRYPSMAEVARELRAIRASLEEAAQASKTKAIAVLPFENISPDRDSDYFSDGLTEELISNLSRLKDIRAVSRTTSMQYRGAKKDAKTIGRELGVRYIVEGSVRRFQDNLRISAQLVDVEADAQLWAETFKGKLADVFDIQEQVSRQVVDALTVKLSPTEKVVLTKRATVNPEAFDCCLRARGFLNRTSRKNLEHAVQLFQRAIELDPRYAAAYAGLGETYSTMYQWISRKDDLLEKAIEAGLKALMYDASLSEAYAALGFAYFNKLAYADAESASQKAIELDPNNFNGFWMLSRIYFAAGRDREAIETLRKVVAINPDFHTVHMVLVMAHRRLGEKAEAERALQAGLGVYPRYLSANPDDAHAHITYAQMLAQAGRVEEARRMGSRSVELSPEDPMLLYNCGCLYALLGDRAAAIDALHRSFDAGFRSNEWLSRDPDLDCLREEPGFLALLRRFTVASPPAGSS